MQVVVGMVGPPMRRRREQRRAGHRHIDSGTVRVVRIQAVWLSTIL